MHPLRFLLTCLVVFGCAAASRADDWPQWRGPQRDGVWRETGIVEKFDAPQLDAKLAHADRQRLQRPDGRQRAVST